MFAPHPPTRITDLLNPVRPPERAPASPTPSPYSEDGRERGHTNRSRQDQGSPTLRSNVEPGGYTKNSASTFTERREDEPHGHVSKHNDNAIIYKSHTHSPTSPYTPQQEQHPSQRAFSLRAASWDTATTYGGEGRRNGRAADVSDDRVETGGMVNVTWTVHHSQTSVRLPSIDREGMCISIADCDHFSVPCTRH